MAALPGMLGDVFFGDAERPLPDWRKDAPEIESDDDDDSPEQIEMVTKMLGFDPTEEADADTDD